MAGCAMQPMGMAQSGVDISLPSPCGWRQTSSKVKLANRLVRRLCYLSLACVSKAYLRNTRHQFFIFAGLFEMFARKILKLYLWEFLICFVVNYLRLEYTTKKGAFWILEQPASSLLPLYGPLEVGFIDWKIFVAHKFVMVMVHPKFNISGAWLPSTTSIPNLLVSHGFPMPLLQALIRRHKANAISFRWGWRGAPTETLGRGKQIQYNLKFENAAAMCPQNGAQCLLGDLSCEKCYSLAV